MPSLTNLTPRFLEDLSEAALKSERRRVHYCIHADHAEPVQILVNAVSMDSYIRPHRHKLDPKIEHLFALRGSFACFTFKDSGEVESLQIFGARGEGAIGVTLTPEVWHTVVALDEGAILLEVKQGPFLERVAKEFPEWAPEEGGPSGQRFLKILKESLPIGK